MASTRVPFVLGVVAVAVTSCKTPEKYVQEADEEVYSILEAVSADVTGEAKTFSIDRNTNRLRDRLLEQVAEDRAPVHIDIPTALDIAAENSREFARQKESLYRSALSLTAQQNEFAVRWGGSIAPTAFGTGDDDASLRFVGDLSASARSPSGGRVVAGLANTLLKSLIAGTGWGKSPVLDLSFTQPLLQGFGEDVTREPLNQAERNVVYAIRTFERFRSTFAVDVVVSYLGVLQQEQNLQNVRSNYDRVKRQRLQFEALFDAGRRPIIDVDRALSDELDAENNIVDAEIALERSLDSFKFQLGLPIDTPIELDPNAFDRLRDLGILMVDLPEQRAIELALQRRFDYRTTLDQVEDAARQIVVAEDSLRSILDFSAGIVVPEEEGKALQFDWSQVSWIAGFNLDLALDRLPQRNTYRVALINLNDRIRSREETEDRLAQQIRNALRGIRSQVASYEIQTRNVTLAEQRVDSTELLYEAGRSEAFDVLDAQAQLLAAQISLTSALVNYATARLELLRDLEAIQVEPKGLRIDLGLPVPTGPQDTRDAARVAATPTP